MERRVGDDGFLARARAFGLSEDDTRQLLGRLRALVAEYRRGQIDRHALVQATIAAGGDAHRQAVAS
ncbi:MAG TPA: hypothetical protein VHK47_06780 [Polyangia bacterium]|nr:hypothetical protein [Polyangia bacterium]